MKNEKELSEEQLQQVQGAGLTASKANSVSAFSAASTPSRFNLSLVEGEEEGKITCPSAGRRALGGAQSKS